MVIDIVLVFMFALTVLIGYKQGFLKGILSFAGTTVTIFFAILVSKPISTVLDKWFNLSKPLAKVFGEGEAAIIGDKGFFALLVIVAVILFILIRLLVWRLNVRITKMKEKREFINKTDAILGMAIGLVKFTINLVMYSFIIFIITSLPFASGLKDWLFNGSKIAEPVYNFVIETFTPLIKNISVKGVVDTLTKIR